jgi:hypothetical protein
MVFPFSGFFSIKLDFFLFLGGKKSMAVHNPSDDKNVIFRNFQFYLESIHRLNQSSSLFHESHPIITHKGLIKQQKGRYEKQKLSKTKKTIIELSSRSSTTRIYPTSFFLKMPFRLYS